MHISYAYIVCIYRMHISEHAGSPVSIHRSEVYVHVRYSYRGRLTYTALSRLLLPRLERSLLSNLDIPLRHTVSSSPRLLVSSSPRLLVSSSPRLLLSRLPPVRPHAVSLNRRCTGEVSTRRARAHAVFSPRCTGPVQLCPHRAAAVSLRPRAACCGGSSPCAYRDAPCPCGGAPASVPRCTGAELTGRRRPMEAYAS
jgi:hypothetical protein